MDYQTFLTRRMKRMFGFVLALIAVSGWMASQVGITQYLARAQSKSGMAYQSKDAMSERMVELDSAIADLRSQLAANPKDESVRAQLAAAIAEYDQISRSLGGDQAPGKTNLLQQRIAAPAVVPPAPPGCSAPTTSTFANATPVPIPDNPGAVATSTINVAGVDTFLFDVDVTVNITHTFPADLDITLQSPSGKIVTLSTDNGGGNDNVFAGTTFDDQANPGGQVPYTTNAGLVNDHPYANLTVATPLAPEEALALFNGDDPNGTWTITIDDDTSIDTGTLNSWSLSIVTCSCGAACELTCPANITVSNDPNQCGAVVNYPPPTSTGDCGTIICNPPSGSFFPVGTTTVTCSAAAMAPLGAGCSTITQSTSQSIVTNNSVSCNNGVGHTDNSYWRAFTLSSFGIIGDFDVMSVDIGVELANAGVAGPTTGKPVIGPSNSAATPTAKGKAAPAGGGNQPLSVRLYTSSMAFPTGFPGSLTLIGSTDTTVVDQALTIINVPVTGTAPAGSQLVVEVFTPNGQAAGNLFFIGSNAAPETGPSYLSAADCGVTTPTATAALGFPDMHIVLNVNGCEQAGSTCTFTVTVNDTQPPTITCPPNQTAVTDQNACPTPPCATVTFPAPTATDNCPGVVVVCNPPSGSCFPTGTTTVTCTATDASGNTATCSFTVTTFDTALQDDSDPSIILLWNSATGAYRFCCKGVIYVGVGKSTIQGCIYTLQHNPVDRRVLGRVDKSVHRGTASIQAPAATTRCTITDRNTLDDTNLTSCQ